MGPIVKPKSINERTLNITTDPFGSQMVVVMDRRFINAETTDVPRITNRLTLPLISVFNSWTIFSCIENERIKFATMPKSIECLINFVKLHKHWQCIAIFEIYYLVKFCKQWRYKAIHSELLCIIK